MPLLCGLREEAALLLRDAAAEFFHDEEHVFPDLTLFANGLVAEQIGGMVGDHDRDALEFEPASAEVAHRGGIAEEALNGGRAKSDDGFRLNDGDLLFKPREACLHLVEFWFAVATFAGRHVGAAFENVRDVDVGALKSHRLDHLREELTRAPDKRLTLLVFIGSGRFSDEHEIGIWIAHSEDNLRAGFDEMWTPRASQSGFSKCLESAKRKLFCKRFCFGIRRLEFRQGHSRPPGNRLKTCLHFFEKRKGFAQCLLKAISHEGRTLSKAGRVLREGNFVEELTQRREGESKLLWFVTA